MAIGNGPMSAHPSSLLSACPQPPLLCCWAPLCSLSPGLSVQVRASSCPFLSTQPAWPAWPVSLPAGPMHSHTSRPHWAGAPAMLLLPAGGLPLPAPLRAKQPRGGKLAHVRPFPGSCLQLTWLLSAPQMPHWNAFPKCYPAGSRKSLPLPNMGLSYPPLCPTGDLSEQIMKGQ